MARSGTTITFASPLAGKKILLTSADLQINNRIIIKGPANGNIIISSGTSSNIIEALYKGDVTFENITFSDSYTHNRSFIINKGKLTMNNCLVTRNKSYNNGGAIRNEGDLTLNDTILSYNQNSGNGGAIYNLFGTININGGQITHNLAYNNGGGIYSSGGHIEMLNSQISMNAASDPAVTNNYGGGIDIVDGSLYISNNTEISYNTSNYYGGGIAIQGSVASISNTTIDHNQAGEKGGGMIVAINTDNNLFSQVELGNITVTNTPGPYYYIGQNTSPNNQEKDIAGHQTPAGPFLQIDDDTDVGIAGNPPPVTSTSNTPKPIGVANINDFCHSEGYGDGTIDYNADSTTDIMINCAPINAHGEDFPGKQVCQEQFQGQAGTDKNIIDRILNYYDPSTLECYKNMQSLGPIGQNLADFDTACKSVAQNIGLYDNHSERATAYDWKCQPKDTHYLPRGLSVTIACQLKYKNKNAFDRLVDYNNPAGWECFAPV